MHLAVLMTAARDCFRLLYTSIPFPNMRTNTMLWAVPSDRVFLMLAKPTFQTNIVGCSRYNTRAELRGATVTVGAAMLFLNLCSMTAMKWAFAIN
jgi:hypothetical protein